MLIGFTLSLPVRGAWVEIFPCFACNYWGRDVAPRAGSVG